MPDHSPCTCPVRWEFTPNPGVIDPHCPVDGAAAILRDAAGRVLAFDPDLAADLSDLANDYAGPYTPEETK